MNARTSLDDLRMDFLATSTQSMPIAGMLYWAVVAFAALRLPPDRLALLVLFGSGMIFPLGVLIDRLTGKRLARSSAGNPLTQMFLQQLVTIVLLWPFVIVAANRANSANLVVLGGALLMGIIWIPYGWAAGDRAGLEHAVGRCILSYAAFFYIPQP